MKLWVCQVLCKNISYYFFVSKFRSNGLVWKFGENPGILTFFMDELLYLIHPLQYALDKFVHLSKTLNKVITIQASKVRLFSILICIDLYQAWDLKDLVYAKSLQKVYFWCKDLLWRFWSSLVDYVRKQKFCFFKTLSKDPLSPNIKGLASKLFL